MQMLDVHFPTTDGRTIIDRRDSIFATAIVVMSPIATVGSSATVAAASATVDMA
jgi:hypothetical protein